jgi:hypothetical protein
VDLARVVAAILAVVEPRVIGEYLNDV